MSKSKLKTTLKAILGSAKTDHWTGSREFKWRHKGGYGGSTFKRAYERLHVAGFRELDHSVHGSACASSMGSGTHWENNEGVRVRVHSTYGVTSRENRFNITVTVPRSWVLEE